MKNLLMSALTVATLTICPTIVFSDADEDTIYIVEQNVTKNLFEAALEAQRPHIVGNLENEFRKRGIVVSNMEVFIDIFMEEFIDEFTLTMQQEAVKYYKIIFTEDQLNDLAVFYASPTGQDLIEKTPEITLWGAKSGAIAGAAAGRNAGPGSIRNSVYEV